MPSLREQQQRFAEALLDAGARVPRIALANGVDATQRVAIYRNNVFANYRNALGASYPVVRRLVGGPFFDTAVDAFVRERPSTAGDLNIYGGEFGDFLAGYRYAEGHPYLADVARLEWAIDEAHRARDVARVPQAVLDALGAVAADALPSIVLGLDPSCRLVASAFPVLRIWQVNQPDFGGDDRVALDSGADRLLVRRDADAVAIARLDAGTLAWLRGLEAGETLGAAFATAQAADAAFDLGTALRTHIAAGTIARIDAPAVR